MPNQRVLVVDDDRDLCDLLSDYLVEEGYEVTRAYLGQDAIDAARHDRPDAALIDLMLPDVSGVAVGRALRETGAGLPIVMISGDRAALARGRQELDASASLEKPFSLAAVEAAVRSALGGSGATSAI